MKKLMLAGASLLMLSGLAAAADLPLKARPRQPVYGWMGWYVGVNGGGAWSSSESETFSGAGPQAAAFFAGNEFPTSLSANSRGGLGGLQTGYNWQLSPMWLVGVETDIQISSYAANSIVTPNPAAPFYPFTTEVSQQSTWFGTVRGRLGLLVTPTILVYGTGGLAYGQTETSFSTLPVGFQCTAFFSCAIGSSSSNRAGWAGGGGVEWMFAPKWTLRAEYLFVDLGSQSVTTAPFTPVAARAYSFTATSPFKENIARAAVNFGF